MYKSDFPRVVLSEKERKNIENTTLYTLLNKASVLSGIRATRGQKQAVKH